MKPILHLSVSNKWGSERMRKWGKVRISLSKPRAVKILLNYTASGKKSSGGGRVVL